MGCVQQSMITATHVWVVSTLLSVSSESPGVTPSPAHPWCGPCQFLNKTDGQCQTCPPHTFMLALRNQFIACAPLCSLVIHPSSHMTVEWPGNCSHAPIYGCEPRYAGKDWENPLDTVCRRPRCSLCVDDCTTVSSGGLPGNREPEGGQSLTPGLVTSGPRTITRQLTNQTTSYQPTSPSSQNDTTPSQDDHTSDSYMLEIALAVTLVVVVAVAVAVLMSVRFRTKLKLIFSRFISCCKFNMNVSPNIPEQSERLEDTHDGSDTEV